MNLKTKKQEVNLLTPRTFAREGRLFNPPPRDRLIRSSSAILIKAAGASGTAAEPRETRGPAVGYIVSRNGPAVYIPEELAEALLSLPPEAQVLVAGLCTLYLDSVDEETRKYHEKHTGDVHGVIKTSVRKLASVMGLSCNGRNHKMLIDTLHTLHFLHFNNVTIGWNGAERIKIRTTPLVTYLEFIFDQQDTFKGRFDTGTVTVHICPPLTDFLLSSKCRGQRVAIPVPALKKLRSKTRRVKYSLPLFLFLLAAIPGKEKSFKIGWEKAAARACIPDETPSGRPMRPSEKRQLVAAIMEDINDTGALVVTENPSGTYWIRHPEEGQDQSPCAPIATSS
ncbi:MAG: hypothetical protein H5U02_08940 [Clostridia bacterium]|nr:hypothetical protein [Clostridia bacterium]